MKYPKEIIALEQEIRSTHNAIWNACRQGRDSSKASRELKRLEKRLEKMKQLFWMVTLSAWIKTLGAK